jgi:GNAT superfamily N-acetyltransferase
MDLAAVLAKYDQHMRRQVVYPDLNRDELPYGVRFIRPAPGMSFILYSRLDTDTADPAIREQISYFGELSRPFVWKVYQHDQPADMGGHLSAQGFQADDPAAIMVLDVPVAPSVLLAPVQADIRQVTTVQDLADIVQVLEAVWGGNFHWVYDRLGGHLAIPGYLSIYAAYAAGRPASIGWTYFPPDNPFASLWAGSTLPDYRRRGLYTAILAARVQEALRRGRRYLVVEAGPESQPIVARHGFTQISTLVDYQWDPPSEADPGRT